MCEFSKFHITYMRDEGIAPGDILVVDRAVTVQSGMIILARVNEEFTVKKFSKRKSGIYLLAAHPRYLPIKITQEMDFEVWGVVIAVVRLLTYRRL